MNDYKCYKMGDRHRIVVQGTICVQHIDHTTKSGWDDNIHFWKEDIPALKKAIKYFEKIRSNDKRRK